jgi:hypothetical protein
VNAACFIFMRFPARETGAWQTALLCAFAPVSAPFIGGHWMSFYKEGRFPCKSWGALPHA